MTKMATMPIYGNNLEKMFFGTDWLMSSKHLGMQYQYYSTPKFVQMMTLLHLFRAGKVKFAPLGIYIGKVFFF